MGLLISLCNGRDEKCLVCGDFKEIIDQSKKWGGQLQDKSQMGAFKTMVMSCELQDLGFRGPHFTWCNHREGMASIGEQLECGLASIASQTQYPEAIVTHDVQHTQMTYLYGWTWSLYVFNALEKNCFVSKLCGW